MTSLKKNILFVDDEDRILNAICRIFSSSDFNIILANSGPKALDVLAEMNINLIVCDIRMPQMDGYQLLRIVKAKYPDITRIILSGFMDENMVFKAMQNGLAKVYMMKPWNNQELLHNITRIMELKEELSNPELMTIVNNMEGLPTIMDIYNRLTQAIENDMGLKEVARIIQQDQALSANVLKIANTAFYGTKMGSINKAVAFLGLVNIKNIVLTTAIIQHSQFPINSVINKKTFWSHGNLTNKIMTFIYTKIKREKPQDLFAAAGLLHDIGKAALLDVYSKTNKSDCKLICHISDIEKAIGISHQKLGGCLMEWWGIPLPIVEAVLFHHDPLNDRVINKELVCFVHLANHYALHLSEDKVEQKADVEWELDQAVFEFLGFTQEECEQLINQNKEELTMEE